MEQDFYDEAIIDELRGDMAKCSRCFAVNNDWRCPDWRCEDCRGAVEYVEEYDAFWGNQ